MTEVNSPTRLSVSVLRADALHKVLWARRSDVESVDAISGLAELFSWPRLLIEAAMDQLVADGRIEENAHGRLIVRKATA